MNKQDAATKLVEIISANAVANPLTGERGKYPLWIRVLSPCHFTVYVTSDAIGVGEKKAMAYVVAIMNKSLAQWLFECPGYGVKRRKNWRRTGFWNLGQFNTTGFFKTFEVVEL